jgi:transposase InsO family protein
MPQCLQERSGKRKLHVQFVDPPHQQLVRLAHWLRPKKSLGGLTPATYARQLAAKTETSTPDSKVGRY